MEPEAYQEMAEMEGIHWWYVGMRAITNRLLSGHLNGRRDLRILDAGCGAGANLSALAHYGKTFGFDYSPLAIDYVRCNHPSQVAQASITAMPYGSNLFDLVVSFDVICVAEVEDDTAAIREMARVARPGGYVLIRVPALPVLRGPHDMVVHGVRRYMAEEMTGKLRKAGLEPVRVTYANSLLLPLALASRLAQNLAIAFGVRPASDVSKSHGVMDRLMLKVLRAEARWIGSGRSFPAGVSLVALACKP